MKQFRQVVFVVVFLVFVLLLLVGVFYIDNFRSHYISRYGNTLATYSEAGAAKVSNWWKQREKEALLIQNNSYLKMLATLLSDNRKRNEALEGINRELSIFREYYSHDFFFIDSDAQVILSNLQGQETKINHVFFDLKIKSKNSDLPVAGFFKSEIDTVIHLYFFFPFHERNAQEKVYMLLRSRSAQVLFDALDVFAVGDLPFQVYPLFVNSETIFTLEPTSKEVSQGLFVTAGFVDDDHVFKMFRDDGPGILTGLGMHHQKVYAFVSKAGSLPIYVVAEIPASYIFNFLRNRLWVMVIFGLAFVGCIIMLILIFTRQQQLKLLRLNRDNELLLDDLINNQPSGIYRVTYFTGQLNVKGAEIDPATFEKIPLKYLFVSKQHESITGISEKDLYDKPKAIFNAIHPEDREGFFEANLQSIRQIKRFKWEGRIIVKGMIRWVSFDSVPRLNPPDQIIWTGVVIDISAQKELELEMESREAFERLITRLSSSFVNITTDTAEDIIQSALGAVGGFCGIDRSYIFAFHKDEKMASNTYEWCTKSIEPQKEHLQGIDMGMLPQWMRMLKEFKVIDVFDVSDLPETWSVEKEILEPQGIKSLLVVPIFSSRKLYGFVGFDSVKNHRKWKEYEVQLLRVFADLLHNAFERERNEASIFEYQQMLRSVLDTIKVRVFWKDRDFVFKGCNEAFAKDAGFEKPDDIIGKTDHEMKWNDHAEKFKADDARVMASGEAMVNIEEKQVLSGGVEKWLSVTKVPLRNHSGEIIGILGTYQDVTSQKVYKDALVASEKRYRILTEKAFDGIYLLRNQHFEYVNQRFCDITGYTYEEITSKDFDNLSLLSSESKQRVLERRQVRNNGEVPPASFEAEIVTQSGEIRQVEISTNNLSDLEQDNLILGIMRDVTEKKSIEKLTSQVAIANQAAQFKQNFLANMSHEIRTPLTGVLGMIEILSKTRLDKSQTDYVNTLKHSTENLREIINQILDYSKIEAGQVKLRNLVFETSMLFQNAKKLFESTCDKDVELLMNISEKIPAYIKADQQRLSQVINNLISNSIKFTKKGKITLSAEVEQELDNQYMIIKITVEDTGIGIKQHALKNLFKPFEQVDHADKRHFEGTGLGLSICKELVTLMHGVIGVSSEEGHGSHFWFTFRARKSSKTDAKKHIAEIAKPKGNPSLKILFAEDKIVNQKVVSLLLKGLGHSVTIASNGLEAVKVYRPGVFDLILMDIQMPEMDGITATKILKEKYKDLPPVVGLSANAFEGDREKYMAQGLDEYITKPIKGDELKSVIQKLKTDK